MSIEPPKIVTRSGNVMMDTFDPELVANFQERYHKTVHRPYAPAFPEDMGLGQPFDFFQWLVTRVTKFNESHDIMINGMRGTGKSACGLSMAQLIQEYINGGIFPADQVCFDIDDYQALTERLSGRGGGVVVLDEVGTEGSLSSRTSMSQSNRSMADVIQLMRTDQIITIYITLDASRVDKRVRDLTSIVATPIRKLTDEEMNGYGLGIEADIRQRTSKMNGAGYLEESLSHFRYGNNGIMKSIIVPHPGITLWNDYTDLRDIRLRDIRDNAM